MNTIIRLGDDESVRGSLYSVCICISQSHNTTEVPGDQQISRLTPNKMSGERTYLQDDHDYSLGRRRICTRLFFYCLYMH